MEYLACLSGRLGLSIFSLQYLKFPSQINSVKAWLCCLLTGVGFDSKMNLSSPNETTQQAKATDMQRQPKTIT